MPLQLVEDAKGDYRNAQFLAVASDLAYFNAAEGTPAFKDQLGLEARLHSRDNTQAYVACNDDHVVVAFRGTEAPTSVEGVKDWLLTDAANLLMVPEGRLGTDFAAAGVGARFHKGFMDALAEIWDPLYADVEAELKRSDRPLWVTGHSLGGALALLAAWLFRRKFMPVHQVYTFGAPMIGNEEATRAFDREFEGRVFRYVNHLDPVPLLPTMSLAANAYGHCMQEIVLGAAAAVAGGGALETFRALGGKMVDGIMNATLLDDVWRCVQDRLGAHAMTNYKSLIDESSRG